MRRDAVFVEVGIAAESTIWQVDVQVGVKDLLVGVSLRSARGGRPP